MDRQRFDDLARTFAAGASRRQVIKGLVGGFLGVGIAGSGMRQAAAGCDPQLDFGDECELAIDCCNPGLQCDPVALVCQVSLDAECGDDDDCLTGAICCTVCTSAECCDTEDIDHCPEGFTCSDGICGEGLCIGVVCTLCSFCDPADGLCYFDCNIEEPCCDVGFTCNPGTGACDQDATEEADCSGDGDCENDLICCGGACSDLECCTEDQSPNSRCQAGYHCFEGICEPNDEDPTPVPDPTTAPTVPSGATAAPTSTPGKTTLPNTGSASGHGSSATWLLGGAALAGGAAILGGKQRRAKKTDAGA